MKTETVKTIVRRCLGYRRGERFLIVCDDKTSDLARGFHETTRLLGIEPVLVQMTPRRMHGEEPPRAVSVSLKEADLAVLLTSMSLSHTKARKVASKCGVRIASLPGATYEMLKRSIPVNYSLLQKDVERLAAILTKGKKVELYTKNGTHLSMSIRGRKGFSDTGLYTKRGAFGNLPAGEACVAPCEGTTEGRLIVDGSAPLVGRIGKPVEIKIKKGYAEEIPFPKIRLLLSPLGKSARNIAELGIGRNPRARVTGNTLEDEKALHTAHIALGNNRSFGGRVSCPSHLDLVFFKPTVIVDGVRIK